MIAETKGCLDSGITSSIQKRILITSLNRYRSQIADKKTTFDFEQHTNIKLSGLDKLGFRKLRKSSFSFLWLECLLFEGSRVPVKSPLVAQRKFEVYVEILRFIQSQNPFIKNPLNKNKRVKDDTEKLDEHQRQKASSNESPTIPEILNHESFCAIKASLEELYNLIKNSENLNSNDQIKIETLKDIIIASLKSLAQLFDINFPSKYYSLEYDLKPLDNILNGRIKDLKKVWTTLLTTFYDCIRGMKLVLTERLVQENKQESKQEDQQEIRIKKFLQKLFDSYGSFLMTKKAYDINWALVDHLLAFYERLSQDIKKPQACQENISLATGNIVLSLHAELKEIKHKKSFMIPLFEDTNGRNQDNIIYSLFSECFDSSLKLAEERIKSFIDEHNDKEIDIEVSLDAYYPGNLDWMETLKKKLQTKISSLKNYLGNATESSKGEIRYEGPKKSLIKHPEKSITLLRYHLFERVLLENSVSEHPDFDLGPRTFYILLNGSSFKTEETLSRFTNMKKNIRVTLSLIEQKSDLQESCQDYQQNNKKAYVMLIFARANGQFHIMMSNIKYELARIQDLLKHNPDLELLSRSRIETNQPTTLKQYIKNLKSVLQERNEFCIVDQHYNIDIIIDLLKNHE